MARQQLPPQIKKKALKNGTERYKLCVDVGINPTTGRRAQFKATYDTADEAKEKLAEVLFQVNKGIYVPTTELTIEQACADWLAGKRIKKTTLTAYTYALQPLRDRHGSLPVQQLTKKHLDDLVNDLVTGMRANDKTGDCKRAPWGPQTVNPMLDRIENVLGSLVAQGQLARNLASLVDRMPGTKKTMETFTEAEVRTLLAEADKDRRGHAWHLALSGLRRGEIGGLRWSDIDFEAGDHGTLTIANNRVSAKGEAVEYNTKTAESARTLPLTPTLHRVLKRAKAQQAAEKLQLGNLYGPGTHVVVNEVGQSYHPDSLSDFWTEICGTAKVRKIRLHDARHTSGTLMHLQGVPVAVIAAWLGHADSAFTMRTYVHAQDDAIRDAAKIWEGLVTKCDQAPSAAATRKKSKNRKHTG
ncbi:tyrosine-type recombinase/integrase [Nocardia jiangxiensis]|uniref:tyrosine-type recombinase/integrase n=1 Tax=Nocardia jiangxiensis TaxID=282685 RepID=UPI000311F187|nr:site-specific integrase [Nocardia jiangxiensis]